MPKELPDLVSLSARSTDDLFTRWIEEHILPWLHWLFFYPFKVNSIIVEVLAIRLTSDTEANVRPGEYRYSAF
jgi:hypothetical protein